MMAAREEQSALCRVETLAKARRLANEWGYWCVYGRWGERAGSRPRLSSGGPEKQYRSPPQWHPPEPKIPEANEVAGCAVQKAFVQLPLHYRRILNAEYVVRPWIVPLKPGEVEVFVARRARISIGAYTLTLERALFSLANIMKFKGLWIDV